MLDWKSRSGNALPLDERTFLKDMASEVSSTGMIVNIGVLLGASMCCLRAGHSTARLVGIDVAEPPSDLAALKAEFIIVDSRICHTELKEITLLFIDGDHHHIVVTADIRNWIPKVVPGGVVIFHDYAPLPIDLAKNPHLEGVRRAVNEWHDEEHWIRLNAPGSMAAFRRPK